MSSETVDRIEFANDPFEDRDNAAKASAGEGPPAYTPEEIAKINAESAAVIASTTVAQQPSLELPTNTYVTLPAGLIIDGVTYTEAQVRELNGDDEEALAKAALSGDSFRYVKVLLDRGVVSVGPVPASPTVLRDLLIGDREVLIMSVRQATFGDDVIIDPYFCPNCGDELVATIQLSTVPIKALESEREFDVPLRKGGTARVRLPDGHVQEATLSNGNITAAEQNTILLSKCVLSITDSNGKAEFISGSTSKVNALGISDRRTILKEFGERQPGPRYDEVKMRHEACDTEVGVPLTVVEMFRGL
jgi:hypothetical protein